MVYHYSVLRFVPDSARDEGINVGIVAGDDEAGDWELRVLSNLRRAKAIDSTGRLPAAMAYLAELEDKIDAWERLDSKQALTLDGLKLNAVEMRNIVQFSTPVPIVAASASLAIELLSPELLVEPETRSLHFEKKYRAVTETRQAYRSNDVPDGSIRRRADTTTGPFEHVFDFGVHNGSVVQLVQCWSFQLPNQVELAEEVKSWGWVVSELRRHGGSMTLEEGEDPVLIPRDLEVAAVYVAPSESNPSPAFLEAQAVFRETETLAVAAEDASIVGYNAKQRLG